ncbi:winged helix DNA-binding protein [Sphingopyxis microcysteis]|jgi:predicted MarR family transcription regulator|uniref:winged helix DNA-binding protein n=1 Tax=Sphingopyxis microcysteis TaxID=2484145 RepID=UPI001447F883|nr:winged helix DNA-binding protein [Sphingopyxis microcysteis]
MSGTMEARAAIRDVDIDTETLVLLAQQEYASRRSREHCFAANIFAEPAWDMLLDLFVQHHRGRPVSIHSLCIAAAVPATTALRWIGKLDDCGLVARERSARDNRVIHVALTARGLAAMERYLGERARPAARTGDIFRRATI